jgi:hypothetical protein
MLISKIIICLNDKMLSKKLKLKKYLKFQIWLSPNFCFLILTFLGAFSHKGLLTFLKSAYNSQFSIPNMTYFKKKKIHLRRAVF